MAKNGAIEVDEYSRTSVPSIWAIGDVTDIKNLTPVALMEGGALAKTVFANEPAKLDYRVIPSAVFSQPPLAQVGLSEEQGRTLFMTLNKIARAVPKYGDVFLLENYAAFQTSLYELANLVPALDELYQQAMLMSKHALVMST